MTETQWNLVINSLSGIVGVFVGTGISLINDSFKEKRQLARDAQKEKKHREKDASYLAIRLVPVLDQFFDACVDIVSDDGTVYGQPAGKDGAYETQTHIPVLSLPLDVDWKSIEQALLKDIMFLSTDLHSAKRAVSAEANDPNSDPDNGEMIAVRRYQYAKIALKCDDILKRLKAIIGVAGNEYDEWWNPPVYCAKFIREFEELQEKREEANARFIEGMR